MSYQAHLYHLVKNSPWPLFTSFSLLSMVIFAVFLYYGFFYVVLIFKWIINLCMIIYFYKIISLNQFNNYHIYLYIFICLVKLLLSIISFDFYDEFYSINSMTGRGLGIPGLPEYDNPNIIGTTTASNNPGLGFSNLPGFDADSRIIVDNSSNATTTNSNVTLNTSNQNNGQHPLGSYFSPPSADLSENKKI